MKPNKVYNRVELQTSNSPLSSEQDKVDKCTKQFQEATRYTEDQDPASAPIAGGVYEYVDSPLSH